MNNFLKTYFLPVFVISLATLLLLYSVLSLGFSVLNGGLILTIISSLVLIYFKEDMKTLKYVFIFSSIFSGIFLSFLVRETGPWLFLSCLLYFVMVVFVDLFGLLFGTIFLKIYNLIIGNHVSTFKNKVILSLVYFSMIVFVVFNSVAKRW